MAGKRKCVESATEEEHTPEYFFKDGYRFVKEYRHTFRMHTKRRWVKKSLWDVLNKEFKLYPSGYFEEAIEKGNIKVNGAKKEKEYILQEGDLIEHSLTRNEMRVVNKKIEIIFEDSDYLVVSKPSSIPMHPCSTFFYNTLSKILQFEYHYSNLLIGHRLDRQTSGICVFSKSKEAAQKYAEFLTKDMIHKVYLARVTGKLEWKPKEAISKRMYTVSEKDAIHNCEDEPMMGEGPRKYREAVTLLKVVSYKEKENVTIVKCYLKTGRTHQIRVHLKSIGYPIENDKIYRTIYNIEQMLATPSIPSEKSSKLNGISYKLTPDGKVIPDVRGEEFEEIYLHAYKYKFGKYKFKTPYPSWAL